MESIKEVKERVDSFRDFMAELSELTGINVTATVDIKKIYDTLTSEEFMNLTLPKWTDGMFPDGQLLDGILLDYEINTYDDSITSSLTGKSSNQFYNYKRVNFIREIFFIFQGKLMKKITSDMIHAMNNTNKHRTKLYLYSCHDINVASVLRSLRVFESHVPEYASSVIIELLKDNNKYYVKVTAINLSFLGTILSTQ